MPVVLRHWWMKRLEKQWQKEREAQKGGAKTTGHTDPFGRKYP
jgi:hypothetical protein